MAGANTLLPFQVGRPIKGLDLIQGQSLQRGHQVEGIGSLGLIQGLIQGQSPESMVDRGIDSLVQGQSPVMLGGQEGRSLGVIPNQSLAMRK